ncbi:hypothetical protein RB653_002412 [Dictyostelium firmibasis]|uniref:Uncharacterized protein n=1 Tax=Dictyostelium firmibasis TaxID=79012 RepID=A0AAN7YQ21_9MYCE
MIKKILSNNKILTSVSQTKVEIQTEKKNIFIKIKNYNNEINFNKTIIFNNNNNNNNNKNNNLNNRGFFTINPQFQNKSYEIFQSLSTPHSLKDTYRILGDISMGSNYKAANIRISFFNKEKDKCDIRGIKLFGDNSKDGWLVIIGGREPSQWNNISLSLYLAALFSQNPLTNFDVIIFPVENPIPISNDTHDHQKRQPLMMFENTITQPHQSLNNSNFSSTNQSQPLFENYPKGKSNALNDWLMKSKKEFTQLKIDRVNSNIIPTGNKIVPHQGGPFHILSNELSHPNRFITNNNNNNNNCAGIENFQFLNTLNNKPNYILNIKNLNFHPSFNIDQLQSFGLNISKQIEKIDMTFDNKKISPVQF